jgi:cell division septation protein DedD
MKKVIPLILLFIIVILVSCGKKEVEKPVETVETVAPEPVEEQVIEPIKEESVVIEEKDFQLQLVASKDIYIVEDTQEVLSRHGYRTSITKRYKDEELFHRLRITGFLTYSAAINMGETLKNDLHLIANYWVEKVK